MICITLESWNIENFNAFKQHLSEAYLVRNFYSFGEQYHFNLEKSKSRVTEFSCAKLSLIHSIDK